MKMKTSSKIYTGIIFAFLFAPIAILIVFSFNSAKSLSVFSGFSTAWYKELFNDSVTLGSVKNTLILALSASLISTVMGTAAAVGINKLRIKWYRAVMDSVTNIPMMNPDIITGISLMLMFVFVGRIFGAATSLNFWTMLIAHITFCLPYVILQVLPKLQQMDPALPEAAMDLGCTPIRAFIKVELPEIMPTISSTDAVRTSIGYYHSFAPLQISRYVTAIANKGTVYNLTLVDKTFNKEKNTVVDNKATVYNKIDMFSNSEWAAVQLGMYNVVNTSANSLNTIYGDLGFTVAGKTGTDQVSLTHPSHGLFISFAPYEDPEISVTVVLPNGYASANAAKLAREVYGLYFNDENKEGLLSGDIKTTTVTDINVSD
jgi:ABC-type spermidine/putrescine transport system permease subunit II